MAQLNPAATDPALALVQWLHERGHYAFASYSQSLWWAATCHLQITFLPPPEASVGKHEEAPAPRRAVHTDALEVSAAAAGEWVALLAEIDARQLRLTDKLSFEVRGEVRHVVGTEDRVLWHPVAELEIVL